MTAKYDHIGVGYNETRKADDYLFTRLRHHLNPSANETYLDIGCGTGNYTDRFQQEGYNFIGIDPSNEMLDKAKEKNANIIWKQGEAEQIKLDNESVGGVIAFLTLHHWKDIEQGFNEIFRVIKPGGKLVIFTSTSEQMKDYWLHEYFSVMMLDSIKQMPALATIEKVLAAVGFYDISTENYTIHPELQDQFLYVGKHDPERYFDKNVQRGISSFSSLANREEIEIGLRKLRQDIDSGKINEIIKSYDNNLGDYLFVTAVKN